MPDVHDVVRVNPVLHYELRILAALAEFFWSAVGNAPLLVVYTSSKFQNQPPPHRRIDLVLDLAAAHCMELAECSDILPALASPIQML